MKQTFRPNSLRLNEFDYSQPSFYFITVCSHNRENILGEIENSRMVLSVSGMIVFDCWKALPQHYPHILLDYFIVMPNHIHGIISFTDTDNPLVGAGQRPAQSFSFPMKYGLSEVIRNFKSFSAREINRTRHTPGITVWQREFHDRVVRNGKELEAIRDYIADNPKKWSKDAEYRDEIKIS